MSKVYFTLTGTKYYFGNDFLKKGYGKVVLVTSSGVICKVCKKSLLTGMDLVEETCLDIDEDCEQLLGDIKE